MQNVADYAEKNSKSWVLTIFSNLSAWICLILQILIVLMVLHHLTSSDYLTWGQNYAKWRQLCRKKLRILFFDYFKILRPWICLILLITIPIIGNCVWWWYQFFLIIWQPVITWSLAHSLPHSLTPSLIHHSLYALLRWWDTWPRGPCCSSQLQLSPQPKNSVCPCVRVSVRQKVLMLPA